MHYFTSVMFAALLATAGSLQAATSDFTPVIDSTQMITEAPAGKVVAYNNRTGIAYANTYWGLSATDYSVNPVPGCYIIGDDGCIYIQNPLSQIHLIPGAPDHYLKLDKVNDEMYVARMPQAISIDYGRTRYAARMIRYDRPETEDFSYKPDTLADGSVDYDVYFRFVDGVITQLGCDELGDEHPEYPYEIIGQMDSDGGWYAYGDSYIQFTPILEVPAHKPAEVATERYTLKATEYSDWEGLKEKQVVVEAAVDGDTFYFKDPTTEQADQWIAGKISDGQVTFDKQFFGIWDRFSLNMWMTPCTYNDNDNDGEFVRSHTNADQLVMAYDPVNKTLVADEGTGFCMQGNEDGTFPMDWFDAPSFTYNSDPAMTPVAPTVGDDWYFAPYNPEWGYGYICFDIQPYDVNGELLDVNQLYYSMYFDDDEPYEIIMEDFPCATELWGETQIPYNYSDGMDILGGYSSSITWYYYFPVAERVGIQSIYKGGNEERTSAITWVNINDDGSYDVVTAIDDVSADSSEAVRYFDLAGRAVAVPSQGFYMRESFDANGHRSVKRIMIK